MYKVLIVDDEDIFRDFLRDQINWEENDFSVCGEAINGANALQLAEVIKPDIAIIDIDMPIMDGLDLSRELKRKYDDIGIILVTGYDKFEYARMAIKIGVEDLFVKPFIESELLGALQRTRDSLYKRRQDHDDWQNNLYEMKERALNAMLGSGYQININDTSKHLERLGVKLKGHSFIVTTIEINNLYQRWDDVDDIADDRQTVLNITNNMLKDKYSHIVFNGPENRIISVIAFKDRSEMISFQYDIYKEIRKFLYDNFDIVVTIGVGTVIEDFMNIRGSYLNSLYAIRNRLHNEAGEVIAYSETKTVSMSVRFYPSIVNEKLTMYLRLNDFIHIKEELDNTFDYCINNLQSPEYNYAIVMGLKAVCLSYISEMNENINNVLGSNFSPTQGIDNLVSMEEARILIDEMFRKTVDYFVRNKLTRTRKVAEMVKEYIDLHYTDSDLSLEKIAKHFFLNYDYIRRAFKKELNLTVTDYITGIRMQKVKKLIDSGNFKLSSLCYEVGISDASYFSKCFKKYFGLSPREYENISKG